MPLLSVRQINTDTFLGLWHLQEPAEVLRQQLQNLVPRAMPLPEFNSQSRQRQWLGGRLTAYTLLQQLTTAQPALVAPEGGKPYFDLPGLHLSITHTRHHVAAILSASCPVGIDMETIDPKVLRVKDKFLTPEEQDAAGGDLNTTLVYWCTKETLYKLHGRKQILFKEHLRVSPLTLQPAGQLQAAIQTSNFQCDYTVHFEVGTDFILTYCLGTPAKQNFV